MYLRECDRNGRVRKQMFISDSRKLLLLHFDRVQHLKQNYKSSKGTHIKGIKEKNLSQLKQDHAWGHSHTQK